MELTSCCGDYASVSPATLATASKATEKESVAITMTCVVLIVLFYGAIFLLCFVMYPKRGKEDDGDEESGDPLPPAERLAEEGARRSEVCVICLEDFKQNDVVRVLVKCHHVFHLPCIDTWCLYRLACPICRAPFRLFNAWSSVS